MSKTSTNGTPSAKNTKTASRRDNPVNILQAIERERERIGRDLHDDICQILTGVSCLLQVSAGRMAQTLPEESARLADINARVIDAMNRARAICHGLNPAKQTGRTIIDTINAIANQSSERFGVKVSKELPTNSMSAVRRHTDRQLRAIFHIAQEAICNAVRHGHASQITLRLVPCENGQISLHIQDNGTGIPKRKKTSDGLGLHIMRWRAAQLGGEIALTPAPQPACGTVLALTYTPAFSTRANNRAQFLT